MFLLETQNLSHSGNPNWRPKCFGSSSKVNVNYPLLTNALDFISGIWLVYFCLATFLLIFVLQRQFYRIYVNVSGIQTVDWRSRMRVCWPLDHPQFYFNGGGAFSWPYFGLKISLRVGNFYTMRYFYLEIFFNDRPLLKNGPIPASLVYFRLFYMTKIKYKLIKALMVG